jgi:hypothetical protein
MAQEQHTDGSPGVCAECRRFRRLTAILGPRSGAIPRDPGVAIAVQNRHLRLIDPVALGGVCSISGQDNRNVGEAAHDDAA